MESHLLEKRFSLSDTEWRVLIYNFLTIHNKTHCCSSTPAKIVGIPTDHKHYKIQIQNPYLMLSPETALKAVLEHERPWILMPLQSWAKVLIQFSPAKKSNLFYMYTIY